MEESSSSPTVMPHVENLMVQSNKNLPVQYDTICEHVDSDSRPSPVSRRKPPPQSESSNEQAWLPDNSECCSVKGDKTPLSKETSVEAGQILASENVTKTDEKSIAQNENSATKNFKIVQSEPSNEQACSLPKKLPVQYDTICKLVDSDSRPSPVSRRKPPPQSESSNEQAWLPDNSECCSVKGDKTPLSKETSVEAGQILASENVTKTDEKSIAQNESSATINFEIVVHEDLPIEKVVNFAPHLNNVKNIRKPKDTFATVQKNHIGNGELHMHVPEVSTEKEDKSNGYNFAKEDDSVKQDQSHCQTLGFPTNIDHCSGENSSTDEWHERDRHCQTLGFPTNIDHCSGENSSTDECHERDRHSCAMPDISPGDLIAIPRFGHLYNHYMVYVGDGDVVHRTINAVDLFCFKKVRIKREKLADIVSDSRMHTLVIENGSWQGHDPLPINEILGRANSKIEEKGFDLYSKNCEHFARWCRYGQEVSKQATNLLSKQQAIRAVLFSWATTMDHCGFPFLHIRGHAGIL